MAVEKPNNGETTNMSNSHEPESLSKKVVRGGIWVFGLRFINRGLGLIRTIILAPSDFDLLGIAMLAISMSPCQKRLGYITAPINVFSHER